LTVFNLDTISGSLQTVQITGSSDNEVTQSTDVIHLAAGISDGRAVMWTYIYPGNHFVIQVNKQFEFKFC